MLTAMTLDKHYVWYYEMYAPFNSDIAPPVSHPFTIFDNLHLLASVMSFLPCSLDDQTIRNVMAQRESELKHLFEQADQQETDLRALDGLDVTAWLPKYNAWRWHLQTRIQIQRVSPTYGMSSILYLVSDTFALS
jgi:hypothetical protein